MEEERKLITTCKYCGWVWTTKAKTIMVSCPSCLNKVEVKTKIKVELNGATKSKKVETPDAHKKTAEYCDKCNDWICDGCHSEIDDCLCDLLPIPNSDPDLARDIEDETKLQEDKKWQR